MTNKIKQKKVKTIDVVKKWLHENFKKDDLIWNDPQT